MNGRFVPSRGGPAGNKVGSSYGWLWPTELLTQPLAPEQLGRAAPGLAVILLGLTHLARSKYAIHMPRITTESVPSGLAKRHLNC